MWNLKRSIRLFALHYQPDPFIQRVCTHKTSSRITKWICLLFLWVIRIYFSTIVHFFKRSLDVFIFSDISFVHHWRKEGKIWIFILRKIGARKTFFCEIHLVHEMDFFSPLLPVSFFWCQSFHPFQDQKRRRILSVKRRKNGLIKLYLLIHRWMHKHLIGITIFHDAPKTTHSKFKMRQVVSNVKM